MILLTVVTLSSSWLLTVQFGSVGLIWSNSINMLLRILHRWHNLAAFIHCGFSHLNHLKVQLLSELAMVDYVLVFMNIFPAQHANHKVNNLLQILLFVKNGFRIWYIYMYVYFPAWLCSMSLSTQMSYMAKLSFINCASVCMQCSVYYIRTFFVSSSCHPHYALLPCWSVIFSFFCAAFVTAISEVAVVFFVYITFLCLIVLFVDRLFII